MEAAGDLFKLMVCGGAMSVVAIAVTIIVVLLVANQHNKRPSDRNERPSRTEE